MNVPGLFHFEKFAVFIISYIILWNTRATEFKTILHLTLSLRGPRLPHRVYPCVALWAFKPSPDILVTSS
jgi:hypothetical protein